MYCSVDVYLLTLKYPLNIDSFIETTGVEYFLDVGARILSDNVELPNEITGLSQSGSLFKGLRRSADPF